MNVQAVICHYGSDSLLNDAIECFEFYCPEVKVNVIDSNKHGYTHGEALDIAFNDIESDLLLTIDNDIILYQTGALERMTELLEPDVYGVGEFVGHDVGFIHPKYALWRREPIIKHKLSFKDCLVYDRECKKTFEYQTGQLLGYQLSLKYGMRGVHFPVLDYAHHLSEKK